MRGRIGAALGIALACTTAASAAPSCHPTTLAEALASCTPIVESPAASGPERSAALLERGRQFATARRWAEALADFDHAVTADAAAFAGMTDAPAYAASRERDAILAKRADMPVADQIAAARARLGAQPADPYYLGRLATLYADDGRYLDGLVLYRELLLTRQPSTLRMMTYMQVASVYHALGDDQRAIANLDAAAGVQPDYALPETMRDSLVAALRRRGGTRDRSVRPEPAGQVIAMAMPPGMGRQDRHPRTAP